MPPIRQSSGSRDASVESAVAARLARIDAVDAGLGSLVHVDGSGALAAARGLDERRRRGQETGPLTGLTFVVKDNIDVAGQVSACGSRAHQDTPAARDALVVERLRAAGAVLLGRANMDELAMGASTATSAFGMTRNPWDPLRSPGGSSGGCAAAVAAELADLAVGTDTGGSVREPAAQCGVVGLAPSPGLVPTHGVVPFAPTFDRVGPLASSVALTATTWEVMAGARRGPTPPQPQRLRVGLVTELTGHPNRPGVRDRFAAAVEALRSAGASVLDVSLPDAGAALETYLALTSAACVPRLGGWVDTGRTGPEAARRVALGRQLRSEGLDVLAVATVERARLRHQARAALRSCDVLLCPTMPTTAPTLAPDGQATADVADPLTAPYTDCWTVVANLAGLPSLSVPVGLSGEDDMPVGAMLTGPAGSDALLLAVGELVEQTLGSDPGVASPA